MRIEALKKKINKLSYTLCKGGMFFAIPLMFLTTFDVIGRSFFSKPIPGTIEISEYMLTIIILLGAAYTQQIKGHVGVDFLLRKLPPNKARIIQISTTILCIIVVSLLTFQGLRHALEERTVSDMLRIPQKPFRFLVFVCGLLLLLEFVADLLELLRRKEGK